MSNVFGTWLEQAGVLVPRQPSGDVAVPIEISPLFALDAAELKQRLAKPLEIKGPTLLE